MKKLLLIIISLIVAIGIILLLVMFPHTVSDSDIQKTRDVDSSNQVLQSQKVNATVELDQRNYTWTDKVYITITDQDANKSTKTTDVIGFDKKIIIATNASSLEYTLVETGRDTGIFTGEIILSGFPSLDVNNDRIDDDASGETSGFGNTDGMIGTDQEDTIRVTYFLSDNETISASSSINFNVGEITFLKALYQLKEMATVRVIDPDLNVRPEFVDSVRIKVISDTDPNGTEIILHETNEASGIFEGQIGFTTDQNSEEGRLKVSYGDEITALYYDKSLPKPHMIGESITMTGKSTVGTKLMPKLS